jgi:hypothetical protein
VPWSSEKLESEARLLPCPFHRDEVAYMFSHSSFVQRSSEWNTSLNDNLLANEAFNVVHETESVSIDVHTTNTATTNIATTNTAVLRIKMMTLNTGVMR